MYLGLEQVRKSVEKLSPFHLFFGNTFLVCKKRKLPTGRMVRFPINVEEKDFLNTYYKPDAHSKYYFTPFRTSAGRWLAPKYPFSGSQSTRTRGDLERAFLHVKNTDKWGWARDYVNVLRAKLERDKTSRVPAFWLAVWLFRERDWPARATGRSIIDFFFREFHIDKEEKAQLFHTLLPDEPSELLFDEYPFSDADLLKVTGPAPDSAPEEGGTLRCLELRGVGPSKVLSFTPGERLTVITGDNGLGKTFLLECAWWSLTGHWPENEAYPRLDAKRNEPSITFEISGRGKPSERKTIKYDWDTQSWPVPRDRPTIPGLIVYARVDGSFAVWDPARHRANSHLRSGVHTLKPLVFGRDEVLRGLEGKLEGLLRDWVSWQRSPDQAVFETFQKVLERLSPPEMGPLKPGVPVRLPHEPRELPTLAHSYGNVPFTYESAGIRRIATIAYLLVWAWHEHQVFAALAKKVPQEKMVVLIDEMEAHLHPKWQRVVLPAILDATAILSRAVEPQLIVATHSPLVLASLETHFSSSSDKLFHLQLTHEHEVVFAQIPFVRYGRVDAWLTSDLFELRQPRSTDGENAFERAKELLRDPKPSETQIKEVSALLRRTLAADDDFWPRWVYFAEKKGVKL